MFKIEIFYITNLAIQRYRQCLNSAAGYEKGEYLPGIQDRSVRMIGPVFSSSPGLPGHPLSGLSPEMPARHRHALQK